MRQSTKQRIIKSHEDYQFDRGALFRHAGESYAFSGGKYGRNTE